MTLGWGVILTFCSCTKINFSKKEILCRDYTMAGVQTEKLALQMTVGFHGQLAGSLSRFTTPPLNITHTYLYKTLPSITCTFYTQYYFEPTNYSLTRVENLLMSFYADFNNSLYLHTK